MARNYTAIHYIQDNLSSFDSHFIEAVVRGFNLLDNTQSGNECMSMTSCLYIIAKKYGYNPELCYGLCNLDGREFYHAWLEINNIVVDLAIYGNVNFSPLSLWDKEMETPYIGTYINAPLEYGKYKYDEDWMYSDIAIISGRTLEQYMDGLPSSAMWKMVCKIMDVIPTRTIVDELRTYTKDLKFDKIA